MPKLDYRGRDMSQYNLNIPKKVTMRLPEMSTRTVWVGAYWEMHNEVVIFHTKPELSAEAEFGNYAGVRDLSSHSKEEVPHYDCYKNKDFIAGSCDGSLFEMLFGFEINSKGLEPIEIFEMEMTAPFDEYGRIISMGFDRDW